MSDIFQACVREALEMQDAPLEDVCERIRTLRQIEICAFSLPVMKGGRDESSHENGSNPGLCP